mgnify:CR=1 FL=1
MMIDLTVVEALAEEMNAKIAAIRGWKREVLFGCWPEWMKPDGERRAVYAWHPWTSDADTLEALDEVITIYPNLSVAFYYAQLTKTWSVDITQWKMTPQLHTIQWSVAGCDKIRSKAICMAIIALAEKMS